MRGAKIELLMHMLLLTRDWLLCRRLEVRHEPQLFVIANAGVRKLTTSHSRHPSLSPLFRHRVAEAGQGILMNSFA